MPSWKDRRIESRHHTKHHSQTGFDLGKSVGISGITIRGVYTPPEIIDFSPQVSLTVFDLNVKAAGGALSPTDIDAVNTWFRQNRDKVVRLYHATSAKHDILYQGLLPTTAGRAKSLQSGSGYVYLSYDPRRARNFAEMAYPGQKIAVYAVEVPVVDLQPDLDQLRNKRLWGGFDIGDTLAESLLYGGGFRVKGKIEPYRIQLIEV